MTIIPEELALYEPDDKLFSKMNNVNLNEKILFEKDSDFHTIQVVENNIGRFLKYGETYQAGFINTKIYKGNLPYINYFLIPYLMNQNIKNILFIGFGSGKILKQYEVLFKKLKRIDIVDIEENIFPIAQKYFDFKVTDKMNFYLQDALIYLKTNKRKYDLIVVDVAGDEGVDERFCNLEYLNLIKKSLSKDGIFVSNMPSSRDVFNPDNKFIFELINEYEKVFSNLKFFNGSTSNKIFYKTFFDIDEEVLDITNLIIISSDKNWDIIPEFEQIDKIGVNIEPYLADIIHKPI